MVSAVGFAAAYQARALTATGLTNAQKMKDLRVVQNGGNGGIWERMEQNRGSCSPSPGPALSPVPTAAVYPRAGAPGGVGALPTPRAEPRCFRGGVGWGRGGHLTAPLQCGPLGVDIYCSIFMTGDWGTAQSHTSATHLIQMNLPPTTAFCRAPAPGCFVVRAGPWLLFRASVPCVLDAVIGILNVGNRAKAGFPFGAALPQLPVLPGGTAASCSPDGGLCEALRHQACRAPSRRVMAMSCRRMT